MQGHVGLGSRVQRRQAIIKKVWVPRFPFHGLNSGWGRPQ